MTMANDLHNEAMEYAGHAFIARMRGNEEDAQTLFEEAFNKESAAIAALEEGERTEPWYSVLHRSAAWLALDCNRIRDSERFAAAALAKDPHPEIAQELREVLKQAFFKRYLQSNQIQLASTDLHVHFTGQEVGNGMMDYAESSVRVDGSLKMIHRIRDWKDKRPFNEKSPTKGIYHFYAGVPEAASYAMTLRLATSLKQTELPGLGLESALGEFVDLMSLVNTASTEEMAERVPEPPYLRNFLGLAKRIAPDGEKVSEVDFTALTEGRERTVALTRRASDVPAFRNQRDRQTEDVQEIRGRLLYADARQANKIMLVDDEERAYSVIVPEGMMSDIVRPMWDSYVWIKGTRKDKRSKSIILEDIAHAEPP